MNQYVIVGNGVAAAGCIEGIRSIDQQGNILVISEENYPVYCRPLISYYLEGKTDLERMKYRDDNFYERMNCRLLKGRKVTRIDAANNNVILDDGTFYPYTRVCVATGSSSFIPSFPGLETVKNAFPFMTIDHMLSLEKTVTPSSRVLIIGAGLIGLKCAEGLQHRAATLTVCDLADRVLSSILDAESAAIVQSHLEKKGITFFLNDTAVRFDENNAVMKSGKRLPFDVLVLAVGVRANTELVQELGGQVDRGILVNERMETSLPTIYAAGDCTQGEEITSGQKRVLAILPNAYLQGHAAGVNMAGGEEAFDKAIPMNSIGFFGLHAMTAGSCNGELYEEQSDNSFKRFFVRDNHLVGYMLIGDTSRAGIYTSLIREKIPLNTINFPLLRETATTAVFSPEVRRKKFGGVV